MPFSHPSALRRATVLRGALLATLVSCGDSSTQPDGTGTPTSASELPIVYAYSEDGRTVSRSLFLTSVDGKTTKPFPALGGDATDPAWRPGGQELVVSHTTTGTRLLLINADGSNARTVPGVNSLARWAPDGSRIVFVNDGSQLLEMMRPDGSDRRRITIVSGDIELAHPTWGGGSVAYTIYLARGATTLGVQQVDSPMGGNLTSGPNDQWPAYSPDGKRIAFSMGIPFDGSGSGWRYEIGLINADGSGRRQLTTDLTAMNFAPTWSPDGQWILYEHWDREMSTCSYVRIPANGGTPVTVVPATPHGACGGASWR